MAKPEAAPAGTQVMSYMEELNAMTIATQAAEKPQSNWASFQGGQLNINGMKMKDNKAPVVVLQSLFENQWYKERYDPNNPATPHCFAFAENDEDLKPHPESLAPQAETCDQCPKNAWGSDPGGGKGKACKNVRRISFISADDIGNEKAEVVFAKIPVMSVKNWSAYASQIANVLKIPPICVKTELSVVPDARTQFQVHFALLDRIPDGPAIQTLLNKRRESNAALTAPYDKPNESVAEGVRKF